jgi:hypothetical protein
MATLVILSRLLTRSSEQNTLKSSKSLSRSIVNAHRHNALTFLGRASDLDSLSKLSTDNPAIEDIIAQDSYNPQGAWLMLSLEDKSADIDKPVIVITVLFSLC